MPSCIQGLSGGSEVKQIATQGGGFSLTGDLEAEAQKPSAGDARDFLL